MKVRCTVIVLFWGFLIASSLLVPKRLNARAAPNSPAQTQGQSSTQSPAKQPPKTTLAGSWILNRAQSDDPLKRVRAAESSRSGTGGYPGNGTPGSGYPSGYPGGYPGGGYPGSGNPGGGRRGGYPQGNGPYGQNASQDIESNPKMQPLIHPSGLLDIELKSPEIDVTDDDLHKLILYTDGRKLQKSKGENNQEGAAHWDGSHLVSDEKSPFGGKMNRIFELSRDGRELYETLHIDNGQSDTPITIRYVYDIATSDTENDQDSDPNRPVLKRNPDDSQSH